MADELDPLFASLRQVNAMLTDPTTLRATGDRRNSMRRAIIAGLSLVAVLLTVVITGLSLRHNTSTPVIPGTSDSPAPPPSSAPAPSTQPPSSPSSPPSAKSVGLHACRPSDFDARPYYGSEGAAGSAYYSITVRNVGDSPCTVTESPVLTGVNERTGRTERVPMTNDSSTTLITIPPGQWGYFTIRTANGFGGYEPSSPACANPRSYRDMVLVLNGSNFALRGYRLSWKCATADAIGWQTARERPIYPTETRAP